VFFLSNPFVYINIISRQRPEMLGELFLHSAAPTWASPSDHGAHSMILKASSPDALGDALESVLLSDLLLSSPLSTGPRGKPPPHPAVAISPLTSAAEALESMCTSTLYCQHLNRAVFTSQLLENECTFEVDDLHALGGPLHKVVAMQISLSANGAIPNTLPALLGAKGFDVTRLSCLSISKRMMSDKLSSILNSPPARLSRCASIRSSVPHFGNATASGANDAPPVHVVDAFIRQAKKCAHPQHKAIVFLVANYGFLPFFYNFMCWYKTLEFGPHSILTKDSFIVLATDDRAYKELKGFGYPVVSAGESLQEVLDPFGSYRTKPYNQIVKQKPRFALLLLEHGFNTFIVDLDIVLRKDPSPFTGPFVEIMASEDDPNAPWGKNLNTGFLFLRNTTCVISMMTSWIQKNEKQKGKEDQQVFNRMHDELLTLNWGSIPRGMYVSTLYRTGLCRCLAKDISPTMMHWNWINGSRRKIQHMKNWGDWLHTGLRDNCAPRRAYSCQPLVCQAKPNERICKKRAIKTSR